MEFLNLKKKLPRVITIPVFLSIVALLFGNNLIPRVWHSINDAGHHNQISKENITVVSFRRGSGSYRTLGNIGQLAEALGFKSLNWTSQGMVKSMEEGWGVPPAMFHSKNGGIFFPAHLKDEAQLMQKALTQGDPALSQVLPLIEASMPEEFVFVGTKTLSKNSILVYAPS